MAALDTVLAKIDANLDSALGRLFKLVEIPSISTDPAYAGACVKAAEWLAAEPRGIGFEASARPTAGHPIIVGQAKVARPDVPHVLFYGHYDVQRLIRSICGGVLPSSRASSRPKLAHLLAPNRRANGEADPPCLSLHRRGSGNDLAHAVQMATAFGKRGSAGGASSLRHRLDWDAAYDHNKSPYKQNFMNSAQGHLLRGQMHNSTYNIASNAKPRNLSSLSPPNRLMRDDASSPPEANSVKAHIAKIKSRLDNYEYARWSAGEHTAIRNFDHSRKVGEGLADAIREWDASSAKPAKARECTPFLP